MIGTNQLQTAELSKVEGGGGFRRRVCGIGVWALAVWCGLLSVRSEAVAVPNGSFEEPQTDFAGPTVAAWQKSAEPAWYQGGGGFPWEQLVGQFLNTTNGSPNHIDNLDGNQAAFLFALPEVAIYQDYNSVGGTDSEPTRRFDATFEPGKWYSLTVGVLGGGGGMKDGATLQLTLYYRDAGGNPVTVASRTVTNSPSLFPTNTHFADFVVRTDVVKATDPWVGRNLGIRIASTVGFELQGGYWDLDQVRLSVEPAPLVSGWVVADGHFRFTIEGVPGDYAVLASDGLNAVGSAWTVIGTISNRTGSVVFTDSGVVVGSRFYRVERK